MEVIPSFDVAVAAAVDANCGERQLYCDAIALRVQPLRRQLHTSLSECSSIPDMGQYVPSSDKRQNMNSTADVWIHMQHQDADPEVDEDAPCEDAVPTRLDEALDASG